MPNHNTEICYECGRSVAPGAGQFINRIPNFDSYQERVKMGVPFPRGKYMCQECDIKIRDKKPTS